MSVTKRMFVLAGLIVGLVAFGSAVAPANATTSCTFTTSGTTMQLNGDCTTDATISVPDGFTLNGRNHTITAVDPSGGHFLGAVVKNGGTTANVTRLGVTTSGLTDACDGGNDRLRGIMFDGASGSISHNTVFGLTQVGSGCQEGNSIEARNCDGDPHQTVQIDHNDVTDFMKTGILANCDVTATMENNTIGASANQANLAANSIQLGFGALGTIEHSRLDGNQWCGASDDAATAILLFESADGSVVSHNDIGGNSDIGIYIGGDYTTVDR